MSTSLPQGTRFDKYEILSLLGKGGMGEVYLAKDRKLDRTVALKILSADVTRNSEHLKRFIQEARATSSLNHPYILTVHDIGNVGTTHYIAAEFIDGVTLRRRMIDQRIKLGEVLDILMHVCEALAAAHEAGIVHRDIKPENIMLRNDGYVKVLDFGLAKLMESDNVQNASPEASTQINIHTDPHAIVGTVDYMSPEQLRKQQVDARSDMWSIGVMLYEMVAGCRPFSGESKSDTIAMILGGDPVPLVEYYEKTPTELQLTVTKLLREEKDGRYQTAKELYSDLKHLKETLDSEEKVARSTLRAGSSGAGASVSSNKVDATAENVPSLPQTNEIPAARQTSGIESLVVEWKNHKALALILLVTILAGVAAVIYWRVVASRVDKTPVAQQLKLTPLRSAENVLVATISPDGKYDATIVGEKGEQSLWVRQISSAINVPLISSAKVEYKGLTFSSNSDYIYFLRVENESSVLYQTPVLGGLPPRKLLEDVPTSVTFSPDGRRLAFVRRYPDEKATALMIANADGTNERRLATRHVPESFDTGGPQLTTGPAWSPDGKVIACTTLKVTEPLLMNLVEVRVDDGTMRQINSTPWVLIGRVSWFADGNSLVFNASDDANSPSQIWRLSYPDGKAKRITNDQNFYTSVGITKDSQDLVAVYSAVASKLWIASNHGEDDAQSSSVTASSEVIYVTWSPDSKLVYSLSAGDTSSIWMMDADGKNQRRLTFDDQGDYEPAVSPNGRDVIFVSSRTSSSHLWRVNVDGGSSTQLTNGSHEDQPVISPDGKWILYRRFNSSGSSVWKLPTAGGDPQQVTERIAQQPAVSPDGKMIACYFRDAQVNSPWKIMVMPFDTGQPVQEFDPSPSADPSSAGLRWRPDGRALTYVATVEGVSNIWELHLDGGATRQITHFKDEQIFSFAWSPDGLQLACIRGNLRGDAVLIKGLN
jgi:serine/threonine protein kinase